ncbi:hypothetical protein ACKWTF_015725 [Chironomus riparius]
MKEILIATLLLGCLIASATAERGLFEFHDTYGRCWRCLPGSSCVRCSTIFVPFVAGPPDPWDRTCGQPTAEICAINPGVKFPHQDIGFYWVCADEGVIVEAPCFCDHVFDMRAQQCVKSDALTSIGCDQYANPDPHDCLSDEPRPPPSTLAPTDTTTPTTTTTTIGGPANTPSVPTAPNDSTTTTPGTTPSVPTAPNEPTTESTTTTTTTTTPINGVTTTTTTAGPTRTTEMAGPGTLDPGNPTPDTTPAPCVCVVWWPCWCNPCWNMPCHSCNGCVGMMG